MILYVCASSGKNLDLTNSLIEAGQKIGGEHKLAHLDELNLPLYNTKAEKDGIPEAAIKLRDDFIQAQALVVIAPEYNGSLPPVLNNAIAWISRSGGEDWREAFAKKFAVVATHSGGGGQKVLAAMRQQLEHLGTNVLARQILTHYQKPLKPESAQAVLSELIEVSS